MELNDWMTLAGSLVVGLGSSYIAVRGIRVKAAQDRAWEEKRELEKENRERIRVLRNYLRVLEDVASDWERSLLGYETSGITNYETYIGKAREEAYHYIDLFVATDRELLRNPLDYMDETHHDEVAAHSYFVGAVTVLRTYLDAQRSK